MRQALWYPDQIVDFTIKGSRIISSDNLIRCKSCDFDLNLAMFGFTKKTWSCFLRRYFTPNNLKRWLESTKYQTPGAENLLSTINPRHKWGPCFLGISFRDKPQARLTLYSRTAIMPTPGVLELSLCSVLARYIEKQCSFLWFASGIWWESLELLSYLIYNNQLEQFMAHNTFLSHAVRSDYEGISSGHQTWAKRKRTLALANRVKEFPQLKVEELQI